MTHRYLRPGWWVARLCGTAERVMSPRFTMPALARAARFEGEVELRRLGSWLQPGAVALDVGANRGIWSWHLRRTGAVVHAFEPNAALAERLRHALPDVVVHACALSDREGEAELRLPVVQGVAYDGWATVETDNRFPTLAVQAERRQRILLRTLDGFRFERVDFLKIDVEGHELAVLRGAEETLRRCRPLLLFEADDRYRPGTVAMCQDWLARRGYRMLPAASPGMWLGHATTPKCGEGS